MTCYRKHNTLSFSTITKWLIVSFILLLSVPSIAQDNKGKIKQTKSVRKKEKSTTKDYAGKRLRVKNSKSGAGRAVYSNTSPYANEKPGKDRAAKPIAGLPRIRSRSAESARNNVYPQKGPFVNRSTKQTKRSTSRSSTRTGRLSTNARITKTYSPRSQSVSQSAETSKRKRFGQGGAYVNQSSRRTENVASGSNRYTRKTKLSAGPRPPGKKRTVIPRSASQQFVTKGKKDVYWGKFSKGEKAITTDISGNPLRRRNYRTPPNEIIAPKDPYEGRKKSKGDRAYSGSFVSGHVSGSKVREKPWIGDVSGQPIRKRDSRRAEVAGKRPVKAAGGSISASGKYRTNKPLRGTPGSISASGKYRSNKSFGGAPVSISATGKYRSNEPFRGRSKTLSVSGKYRDNTFRPQGGGSISGNARYRSNQPIRAKAPGLGAVAQGKSQGRMNGVKPAKAGGGSISASGKYRSNQPFRGRFGPLSISGKNRVYDFKPNGGGSVSGKLWNNNNQPINARTPGIGATSLARYDRKVNPKGPTKIFSQGGLNYHKGSGAERARKGNLMATEKTWNNNNQPLPAPNYGKKAGRVAKFQGNAKVREPEKGGGSVSGKLWNNDGKPIEVRIPTGAEAAKVDYAAKKKLPLFKRAYARNPNAVEAALKKQTVSETVYMTLGIPVSVKAKETGKKPKAVKGSMPGLAPSKATVKASEYSSSMKVYWKYKHNPMSDKEALKVIAPGRAYARITDYQGNVKMSKYNDKRFLPDSRFAHSNQNNVKQERTIMTDIKLLWAKIFKKNGTQPDAVKEKSVRPRYDKRERELWPGLYD